jgi:hypothetical protein
MSIKPIILPIVILDFALALYSLSVGSNWLINSQIAFISSFIVTIASFFSYRALIKRRLEQGDIGIDDKDIISEIEDPYDLYDEGETKSDKDLKEIIKEERDRLKGVKSGAKNVAKSISGIFSPYRLLSYLILVVGFLYLVNSKSFLLLPYLLGLSVVPIGSLISIFFKRG